MKKIIVVMAGAMLLFTSCVNQFNQIYKSTDNDLKYEYAKECYARGKYVKATTLLRELVTIQKGTDNAEESLFMLAMAEFKDKDYETAAEYFKKYYKSYPKGMYAELASYYIGESLYMCTPEPRLDQSQTVSAISAFQDYMDFAVYTYAAVDLEDSFYFSPLTEGDLETMSAFLDDFEGWIDAVRRSDPQNEVVVNYQFDRSMMDTGDWFYIYENPEYSKFGCYDIWFLDSQTNVLYYFHNNI